MNGEPMEKLFEDLRQISPFSKLSDANFKLFLNAVIEQGGIYAPYLTLTVITDGFQEIP
jgi:hypothetical protein